MFTTMQETQDIFLAVGFVIGIACSGTVLVQVALYRGNAMPVGDADEKKSK